MTSKRGLGGEGHYICTSLPWVARRSLSLENCDQLHCRTRIPVQSSKSAMSPHDLPTVGDSSTEGSVVGKSDLASDRKRKWHTKTRNGCKTCKKRRVRCDETKPVCNRCTSLNKVCEGYEPPQVSRPTSRDSSSLIDGVRYGCSNLKQTRQEYALEFPGAPFDVAWHDPIAELCSTSTREQYHCSATSVPPLTISGR
jgi:hypothetical protein